MEMLPPGKRAPDFCLPDAKGTEICLKDFRGKWIVLYFYPRDNTPACTLEAKGFSDELDAFGDLDAKVIGVSKDSPESHTKFIEKHDLKVLLLADPAHHVLEAYKVWQLKKLYGKESLGTVRSTYLIGPDGIIREVWAKVKVKGHVEEVKKRLEDLRKPG
jgi:peroxiredoxin Q/BCP